ncbi:MAG: hypothetical protein A4E32_01473 [Methanomassiliicoccales archaeon PtaU1.Bin124]|nr:MAG: hypothetical protein A4E32_01473 [Methanomassiliicoccales archaeon PtaU1.Bin124]
MAYKGAVENRIDQLVLENYCLHLNREQENHGKTGLIQKGDGGACN